MDDIALRARACRPHSIHIGILKLIRRLYMALHQGTNAAQLHSRASTPVYDKIFEKAVVVSNLPTRRPSPRLATWCFPRCRRPPGYHPMSARGYNRPSTRW